MSNDLNWINDQLHSLIGLSDAHTVNYIVAISKNAKKIQDVYKGLIDFDFPEGDSLQNFSENLFQKYGAKVNNNIPKLSDYEQNEVDLIQKRNYNESFNLIKSSVKHVKKVNKEEDLKDHFLPEIEDKFLSKKRNKEEEEEDHEIHKSNIDLLTDVININTIDDKELKTLLKEKDILERERAEANKGERH